MANKDDTLERFMAAGEEALTEDAKRFLTAGEEENPFGFRADKTPKGFGFFGPIRTDDDRIMTELGIGVDFDGKETQIPLLVPLLDKDEIELLRTGGKPTEEIINKAVEHAKFRMSAGKSPFAELGEQQLISQE